MVTVTVTGAASLKSVVTDASGCGFGTQFSLKYVQSHGRENSASLFTLVASNPGQFGYNVFFNGTAGTPVTLTISIPYPFVTQGSVPIQAFTNFQIRSGCFAPVNDVTSSFSITGPSSGSSSIVLSNYSPQAIASTVTVTVSGKIPISGMVYVTIHLNYGLRGGLFGRSGSDAANPLTGQVVVPNGAQYIFSVNAAGLTSSQTVTSQNTFNRVQGTSGSSTGQTCDTSGDDSDSPDDCGGNLAVSTFSDECEGNHHDELRMARLLVATMSLILDIPPGSLLWPCC